MTDNVIQIVCCTDHRFVMPCGVMLKSLFVNNRNNDIHVHVIIDNSVTNDDQSRIKYIVVDEHKGRLSFYNSDEIQFRSFPNLGEHTHVSKATYYRLFMTSILPQELTKVLYLDVDLLVLNDLSELWEYSIENVAFAAVIDHSTSAIEHYNRMQYSYNDNVINAGVLLINLTYWRKYQLQDKFVEFIQKYPQRIKFHDQDVLNCVLHKQKKLLPLKYNVQTAFFYKPAYLKIDLMHYKVELEEAKKEPIILHFSTGTKPWNEDCVHPLRSEFIKYQKMTYWKGIIYKSQISRPQLRTICGDILRFLHLRRMPNETNIFFE